MAFASVLLLLFAAPLLFVLADTANSGIAPGNIWYSKDPFEEGDKIQVYTVIFNSDTREMSGTVEFYDDVLLLGEKDFVLKPNEAKSVSVDWEISQGTHKVFAKIVNAKFKNQNGTYDSVVLANSETETSTRTVAKKILPAEATQNNANAPSISHIENLVNKNAPPFLAQPFVHAAEAVEGFRQNAAGVAEQKFPFIAFIFSNWIIFYILFALAIFLAIRFIWRLIF